MARFLDILGNILLAIGGAIVLFGHLSVWYFQGFWAMAELLQPWNVANFIMTLLMLAPGLLLKLWASKLRERAQRRAQVPPIDAA